MYPLLVRQKIYTNSVVRQIHGRTERLDVGVVQVKLLTTVDTVKYLLHER